MVLYLTSILQYDEDESTIIYHMTVFLAYFSPIFGAIVSDSYLGKFKYVYIGTHIISWNIQYPLKYVNDFRFTYTVRIIADNEYFIKYYYY